MNEEESGVVSEVAARAARHTGSVLTPAVDPNATAEPGPHGEPKADLERTGAAIEKRTVRSTSIVILAVLAVLYTLYFARDFFIPIVFAVLLNFLLSPLLRALARLRIPPPAGAALVVVALFGAVGGGVYSLSGPAQQIAASAPETLKAASKRLRRIILPVQQATSQVERVAGTLGDSAGARPQRQLVVNSSPSITSRIFGTTQKLVAGILEVVILLYFLLAGGDLFLQKFIKVLPHSGDKKKAVEIARAIESAVSAYLSTAFMVNLVEGAVVALLLWRLQMPSPVLWGVMAGFLEFIPYLGAFAAVVILGLAGLATFDSVPHALLIPGSYLAVNLIQANFVTPMLLGHRLTLNPVAIFIGLTFFFWIWGVPGAFMAVPLLATLKIFCDNIASLAALGEFLGERDDGERRVMIR
ncbi:MAG TPA: AI-2E family transporter [Gemmatimonadaceae bacterium]|jgi:predicted PurR-regulated permease PerM